MIVPNTLLNVSILPHFVKKMLETINEFRHERPCVIDSLQMMEDHASRDYWLLCHWYWEPLGTTLPEAAKIRMNLTLKREGETIALITAACENLCAKIQAGAPVWQLVIPIPEEEQARLIYIATRQSRIMELDWRPPESMPEDYSAF